MLICGFLQVEASLILSIPAHSRTFFVVYLLYIRNNFVVYFVRTILSKLEVYIICIE